ncbi:unnamed protein product [Durusdinium trenchii]|uniref:Peptide deformylase n=1 Tax=Durusdinium trenchii TaxID=1381693 RepID=A0ABP0HH99_9DINO
MRRKAKLVKPERISKEKSQNVAEELVSVMRGPKLPGRDFKGGFLTAPHLGTPSRLVVFEDPPVAVEKLSEEERALQGRERAFGCKAVFNPRWRSASNVTSVFWEKDPSIPGYRALVERPNAVRVQGYDPKGQAVDYVAKGWEARLIQQANDLLNGLTFVDRCEMRSLCHLDARNDPLPSDCPVLGAFLSRPSRPPLSEEDTKAAETGGSKGMLGFLPSFGSPSVLLIGSLLLRLPAREVEDFSAGEVQEAAKELRDALASGEHPLGVAAPQFGKGIRMVAIGETEDNIEKLTTRAQISEEHRVFKPTILINPVVTAKPGGPAWAVLAFFFERLGTLAVVDKAPSWDELKSALEAEASPELKDFRTNLAEGHVANAMAKLRVFGQGAEATKRVTLYRDSASWCPYCHKVWMLLEEKQIPYNVKKVSMSCYGDKPADFIAMQPNGQIPVAVIDGTVLRSSDAIIERVLQMPGASPQMDQQLDPFDHPQSTNLLRLERMLFSSWLGWLCRGGGRSDFERTLRKVEDTLAASGGPYFLGERFSLVDIMYTPFIERAVASLAYFKGYNIREKLLFPAINRWFDAMETRDSYRATKSDYYTHSHDLPPQLGGCQSEPGGQEIREAVDGGDWKLPLKTSVEPEWSWISSRDARHEAAERLIHNHEAVSRFAARAKSGPGFPPAWAELADPNAKPAEKWVPIIDIFLRHAVDLLLSGDAEAADRDEPTPERQRAWAAAEESLASLGREDRADLAECLRYLQQRVGVPRDMCASVPGYEAVVGRPLEVSVEAMNEEGRRVSFSAKGWQARQLQHTVDILEGVLYVDRMETRSFRRDTVEEDLPEGVPYGVKSKAKVADRTRVAAASGGRKRRS